MNKTAAANRPYFTARLKSGLRLLAVPRLETKAVTVFVLCKVGSRYETPRLNGVSHFLEHLMFKGTERRPNTLAISRLLDGVGAEYNAFTAKDHTGYYVKINSDHLGLALDVVSDMLYHSKFDPTEIDRERKVIIEEISMYEDNPLMYIEDVFERAMYAGSPLGQLIAGPRAVIRSISRRRIVSFFKEHYRPANMMVVVAGRFDPATITAAVGSVFNPPSSRPGPQQFRRYRLWPTGPRVALETKETEQVQIGLGYPAVSYFDRRLPAVSLLSTILGGNMSSRLFISIRERRGLCYAIRCSPTVYEDTGNLFIQAGVARDRTQEAIKAILAELDRLADKGISTVELKRAKEYTRGRLVLELEDSESLGAWFGKQWLLTSRVETPAEKLAKVQAVTTADIRSLARSLFRRRGLTLAMIGPDKDIKTYQRLIKRA